MLSPQHSTALLQRKHGDAMIRSWQQRREQTLAAVADYEQKTLTGEAKPVYQFGEDVLSGEDLDISASRIQVSGRPLAVEFSDDPGFSEFL